jgi:hypothetical protein
VVPAKAVDWEWGFLLSLRRPLVSIDDVQVLRPGFHLHSTTGSTRAICILASADLYVSGGLLQNAPMIKYKIRDWVGRVASFKLNGQIKPDEKMVVVIPLFHS